MKLLHKRDRNTAAFRSAEKVPPGIHGSLDFAELQQLGLKPERVLDFSANINPYGPSEAVRQALAGVAIDRYPDRECLALRHALANEHHVPIANILPGNGVSELIWLTAMVLVDPGESVLVVGPTYCEYARAARLRNARVHFYQARADAAFVPDPQIIAVQLGNLQPRLVFICNPNNPTGAVIAPLTIAGWAEAFPRTLFVVDEAYLPFAAGLDSAFDESKENLLILRSLTKDCGLAGLRLGYAIGHPGVIENLRQMQPPWSVNALAQAAGIAALADPDHRRHTLALIAAAKQELTCGLSRLELACLPSLTHYFLMRPPHGDGRLLRQALLSRAILIRDCASFELPAFVRIATRRPEENQRLLTALAEVL